MRTLVIVSGLSALILLGFLVYVCSALEFENPKPAGGFFIERAVVNGKLLTESELKGSAAGQWLDVAIPDDGLIRLLPCWRDFRLEAGQVILAQVAHGAMRSGWDVGVSVRLLKGTAQVLVKNPEVVEWKVTGMPRNEGIRITFPVSMKELPSSEFPSTLMVPTKLGGFVDELPSSASFRFTLESGAWSREVMLSVRDPQFTDGWEPIYRPIPWPVKVFRAIGRLLLVRPVYNPLTSPAPEILEFIHRPDTSETAGEGER